MKSPKVLFALAAVFLLAAGVCCAAFFFLPEKIENTGGKNGRDQQIMEETAVPEENVPQEDVLLEDVPDKAADEVFLEPVRDESEADETDKKTVVIDENAIKSEAEREIKRFKEVYGIDISMEDMCYQLKIRAEYEQLYDLTYDMEDIFLLDASDETEGDPGACIESDRDDPMLLEENVVAVRLRQYEALYDIDETRYEGMSEREKLSAIEIEYGPLDENGQPLIDEADDMESESPETQEQGGGQHEENMAD